MLDQADAGMTNDTKMPGWCRALNVVFDMKVNDGWWKIVERVADGKPSEIDYIYDHWSLERIARHFALDVQRQTIKNYTP